MKPVHFFFIFAGIFTVLTTKDAIESYMEKRAGQTVAPVVSTIHTIKSPTEISPCQEPDDNDSSAVLLAKLTDCRAQLEELTQQAHDEFDMD